MLDRSATMYVPVAVTPPSVRDRVVHCPLCALIEPSSTLVEVRWYCQWRSSTVNSTCHVTPLVTVVVRQSPIAG